VKLQLRLSEALRRRIERAAAASDQSMNSEIIHRLERSIRRDDFQETQDAINEGMLQIMQVVADVLEHSPAIPKREGLLSLAKLIQPSQQPPTDKGEDSK
jgi:hypothetical protein